MKTIDWKKVDEIILDALELGEAERREFIEKHCLDAPEMRSEIESLLAGESAAEKFFGLPAVNNYADFFGKDEDSEALAGQQVNT